MKKHSHKHRTQYTFRIGNNKFKKRCLKAILSQPSINKHPYINTLALGNISIKAKAEKIIWNLLFQRQHLCVYLNFKFNSIVSYTS